MVIDILRALFGGGANVVRETAEVFRVNAEAADQRSTETQRAALDQMAGEFKIQNRGAFDRLIDGLNRIPRPAMALGTLGLFVAAMVDPLWFGERMAGLIAATIARAPQVAETITTLRQLRADSPGMAETRSDAPLALAALAPAGNPALEDWNRSRV
jgi:hypothetical protein